MPSVLSCMVGLYAAAALLALALDYFLGEPPAWAHPVVGMGRYLAWSGRGVQRCTGQPDRASADWRAFWLGALAWCAGALAVGLLALLVQSLVQAGPFWLAVLLLGLALKPMLAWHMLRDEVLAVERALGQSLHAGRERLAWLVSRDVSTLSETQVRESAIESLAENLNDSVVAPLFWFALLGLPGAALYRFANTADAMWGYPGVYRGQDWAWAGKWAARADDVLSWLPARLTALLLALAGGGLSLAVLRREAAQTPSPNSGWPMAAMALALGVGLRKPGVYALNPAGRAPREQDTRRALHCAGKVLAILSLIAFAAIVFVANEVWA
ncbi:adenosylcobinamide-phosphate synthase CbiB [Rhodoferax sp.]|uniref:adenosylcobinamide-phosphate synthase CbiB n=1 Tax=Rhodoferax sp. TaxID=50421 RepID=UPI0027430CD4|nr:adenosylcobinamide-phosphate synthase CbiB [Rhodoferax sp.]